jgi:ribonuclease HII
MEEVNDSKVLHEQMREMVFHEYQYFKNKVWALEGDASHQVVAHSVAWCQKHVASHFQPHRQLQVRHHHHYS